MGRLRWSAIIADIDGPESLLANSDPFFEDLLSFFGVVRQNILQSNDLVVDAFLQDGLSDACHQCFVLRAFRHRWQFGFEHQTFSGVVCCPYERESMPLASFATTEFFDGNTPHERTVRRHWFAIIAVQQLLQTFFLSGRVVLPPHFPTIHEPQEMSRGLLGSGQSHKVLRHQRTEGQ